MRLLLVYFLAVNVVAFVMYGIDKYKARHGRWRISEFALLMAAAVGGSIGAWAGMKVWRHKTMHKKFKYGVPLLFALHISLLVAFLVYWKKSPFVHNPHDNISQCLQLKVDSLLSISPMDVGVAVGYDGGILCAANADKRFPMMSVFKLHQAVAVVDSMANGSPLSLDTKVFITKAMLRENTYSPMRDAHPDGNVRLTVGQLLRHSLLQSDNNACDILFSLFGGTAYVQSKVAAMGLHDTQIRWTEDDMHRDVGRTTDNYTTPREALRVVEAAYADPWLKACLAECATGQNRIPALLPKHGVTIGHKTGTGDAGSDGRQHGVNDVGFVVLPDGRHYTIAVFCDNSRATFEETEAVIAGVSRLAYDFITNTAAHE